jgi:hypothetical protein
VFFGPQAKKVWETLLFMIVQVGRKETFFAIKEVCSNEGI